MVGATHAARWFHGMANQDGTDWLEVPTIFWGLCKGISQQNMARNLVQYLHFRILKFPTDVSMYFLGKTRYCMFRADISWTPLSNFGDSGLGWHKWAFVPSPC